MTCSEHTSNTEYIRKFKIESAITQMPKQREYSTISLVGKCLVTHTEFLVLRS